MSIRGPDGNLYAEPWWNEPAVPIELPSSTVANMLIKQINEAPGGKQSCGLTAQLNALIIRRSIDTDMALTIQDKLADDQTYARCWQPSEDGSYKGWRGHPYMLAFILKHDFDTPVGVRYIESPDIVTTIEDKLREGYVAALIGRSVAGRHTRLGFAPEDGNDQFFVYDSKYPETTGFYDYDQLPDFQTTNFAIIY